MAKLIKNDLKWTSIVSLAFREIYAKEPTNLEPTMAIFLEFALFFI
jgi:hypothetical protein